mgnify:CR=1 FL=1
MSNTNQPFSLNISTDTVPDVSLEHDSTTDEVHIKFFNVDNELVLDLGGLLNDVGPLLSGLSIIAKYHALRTGLCKAVAEDDLVGAVEILRALNDLQHTPEFDRVFENVDITTGESPKKDPEEPRLSESGIAVLTGKETEVLLAMLDEMFNGK